jgi:hypothetical protein
MRPEDDFTSTVEAAAAFERWHSDYEPEPDYDEQLEREAWSEEREAEARVLRARLRSQGLLP